MFLQGQLCDMLMECLHADVCALFQICGDSEEPKTAHPMSYTWASYIAASVHMGH